MSWDQHLKMLKQKLSRTNGLLAKTRYYLLLNLRKTLYFSLFESHLRHECLQNPRRTLYFSIFESHLRHGCQIWGQQKGQHIHDIENLQGKANRIMNLKK